MLVPAIVKTALLLLIFNPFVTLSVFDNVSVMFTLLTASDLQVEATLTVGAYVVLALITTSSPEPGTVPPQFVGSFQLTLAVPTQVLVAALLILLNAKTNSIVKKSIGLFKLLRGILLDTYVSILYVILRYFRFFKTKNIVNIKNIFVCV